MKVRKGTKFNQGHGSEIVTLRVSASGSQVLSGSTDKTLKLWDIATGECQQTFVGHQDHIYSVYISQDSRYALSGSRDQTMKRWDIEASGVFGKHPGGIEATGECQQTFIGHSGAVMAVCESADGRYGFSGSTDKSIKQWDIATGKCLRTLEGHQGPVRSLALSPDGSQLLSGSFDRSLKLWDIASGKCLLTMTGHQKEVMSVEISADGKYALSGSRDQTVKLWELETGALVKEFPERLPDAEAEEELNSGDIYAVSLSPDMGIALSGTADGILQIWEVQTGKCLHELENENGEPFYAVALTPDSRYILVGSSEFGVRSSELGTESFPEESGGQTIVKWEIEREPEDPPQPPLERGGPEADPTSLTWAPEETLTPPFGRGAGGDPASQQLQEKRGPEETLTPPFGRGAGGDPLVAGPAYAPPTPQTKGGGGAACGAEAAPASTGGG
ncbi:MAG: WD40 repeat domain-containing protein, partial [Hormoscilla sp.]